MIPSTVDLNPSLKALDGLPSRLVLPICKQCYDIGCIIIVRESHQNARANHARLNAEKRSEALREEVVEGLLQDDSEGAACTTTAGEEHHEAVEASAPETKRKTRATRKRDPLKRLASGNKRNKRNKAIECDKPCMIEAHLSFMP